MTHDEERSMNRSMNIGRRRVLAAGAGAAAAATFGGTARAFAAQDSAPAAAPASKPLPAYVSWKDASSVIVHSSNTLETKRTAFGTSIITPSDRLYIRNNVSPPPASIVENRDAWELAVSGVRQPRTLKVADLKTIGVETVAMVLQCSGNGRGYFPHKPSGTPWKVGAAGCVEWSGVPVRAVVAALGGVADGAQYMTSTGGERVPEGIDPLTILVERSVPLAAMQDALLAWEMNGEPVPLAHGGPLRIIVPGYTGVNSVKYIRQLAFAPNQTEAAIQKTRYRLTPMGQKGDPAQPSVWEMGPKSWVNSPAPEAGPVRRGLVQITGVAFGGMNGVQRVDVSLDGGKSWQQARLFGPDMGRYAWRQFVLPAKLEPGTYTIASRVTDSRGGVQPEQRMENAPGYINSSWRDHAVQITVG
jgi:sulfite dehydrogenase